MARKRKRKIPPSSWFVYLHDEAPRLGCGWRFVQVITTGHKWARLRVPSIEHSTVRIPIKTWEAIAAKGKAL